MLDMNIFNSVYGMLCDFSDEGASAILNFFKGRVQNAKFQSDVNIALKKYRGGSDAFEKDLKAFISITLAPEKEEKIKKKINKLEAKGKSIKPTVDDYLDFFSIRTANEISSEFIAFKAERNEFIDENSKKAFNEVILLSRKILVESYQSMISNESKAIIVTLTDMFEKFASNNSMTSLYQTFYDVPEECPTCSSYDFHIEREIFVCASCGKKINLISLSVKKTPLEEIYQSLSKSIDETYKATIKAIEESQKEIIDTLSNKLDEAKNDIIEYVEDSSLEVITVVLDTAEKTVETVNKNTDNILGAVSESTESVVETVEKSTDEVLEAIEENACDIVDAIDEGKDIVLDAIGESTDNIVEAINENSEDIQATINESKAEIVDIVSDEFDKLNEKLDEVSRNMQRQVNADVECKLQGVETSTADAIEKANEKVIDVVEAATALNTANTAIATENIINSIKESEEKNKEFIANENQKTQEKMLEAVEAAAALNTVNTVVATENIINSIKENEEKNKEFIANENQKTQEKLDDFNQQLSKIGEMLQNVVSSSKPPKKVKTASSITIEPDESDDDIDWSEFDEEDEVVVGEGYARNGYTVLFGSYPQTKVTNEKLISVLNKKSLPLPFNNQSQNWTSYGYYINNKVVDFMWYIDITLGSRKYRGVYFTAQRPSYTTQATSLSNYSFQDESGYDVGKVYWFKYEPISWTVLTEDKANKTALIVSNIALDAREYYLNSTSRKIDGKTVYPCSYEHSTVRRWLNDCFYKTAFDDVQKSLVQFTEIENGPTNGASTLSFMNTSKTVEKTVDRVFLLSYSEVNNGNSSGFAFTTKDNPLYQKRTSDYARSQGAYTQHENGEWWLRSPIFNANSSFVVVVDSNGRSLTTGCTVERADRAIVPALTIKLDNNK